jgi:hypothetical protein
VPRDERAGEKRVRGGAGRLSRSNARSALGACVRGAMRRCSGGTSGFRHTAETRVAAAPKRRARVAAVQKTRSLCEDAVGRNRKRR